MKCIECKHLNDCVNSPSRILIQTRDGVSCFKSKGKILTENKVDISSHSFDTFIFGQENVQNAMRLVFEMTKKGFVKYEIITKVKESGFSLDEATKIVETTFEYKKIYERRQGLNYIFDGIGLLILGGIVTGIFYGVAKFTGLSSYLITSGLFLSGLISIAIGISKVLS